jgi:hypothetical protein
LPEVVSANGLTASRVGDEVTLHWTTPTHTTDKLLISGPIVAEICRETVMAGTAAIGIQEKARPAGVGQGASQNAGKPAATGPCSPVVLRENVTPGVSEAVDPLPPSLTSGAARALAYRVQLLNAAGRTAGASPVVYAASGPAPQPVEGLTGTATKAGVVLEWKREPEKAGNGEPEIGVDAVELDRTTLASQAAAAKTAATATAKAAAKTPAGIGFAPKQASGSSFAAGNVDAGGAVDHTAQIGDTYSYTAQRVRSLVLEGKTLEVRSMPSAAVPVEVRDVFPPDAPVGLVAVPGFAGEGEKQTPAIDLSWEPNMEPRIAGYRVYRREAEGAAASGWRQLDEELLPVAAYRDTTVAPGHRYAYRVTAVSQAGNESAPSAEATETAPVP